LACVNTWEDFGNVTYRKFYWLLEMAFRLHVAVNSMKRTEVVNCPIFLSDFNQNGVF
jgi:hypothetical protein